MFLYEKYLPVLKHTYAFLQNFIFSCKIYGCPADRISTVSAQYQHSINTVSAPYQQAIFALDGKIVIFSKKNNDFYIEEGKTLSNTLCAFFSRAIFHTGQYILNHPKDITVKNNHVNSLQKVHTKGCANLIHVESNILIS